MCSLGEVADLSFESKDQSSSVNVESAVRDTKKEEDLLASSLTPSASRPLHSYFDTPTKVYSHSYKLVYYKWPT
jgi:hypothetical protein